MNELNYPSVAYHALGLELLLPDPVQVKSAYESGVCLEFPYWSKIWPSSYALASWIQEQPRYIAGKDVLEIGAGIGLPSFIASTFATSVTISDHIREAITWIDLNIINHRSQNMKSRLVDWRSRPLPFADVILLSDIGYDEVNFTDIREMISQYIRSGSMILLSIPFRIISAGFVTLIDEFVLTKSMVTAMDTDILLLRLGSKESL
jgi:predicted nicotinamide N-methyase